MPASSARFRARLWLGGASMFVLMAASHAALAAEAAGAGPSTAGSAARPVVSVGSTEVSAAPAAGETFTSIRSHAGATVGGVGASGVSTSAGGVGINTDSPLAILPTGRVTGGQGGDAAGSNRAGAGGAAVVSSLGLVIDAGGLLTGGGGGKGSSGGGGDGGAGVVLDGGALDNQGAVVGGAGGSSVMSSGGDGGAGLIVRRGAVYNGSLGQITGGAGAAGQTSSDVSQGGAGVTGANISLYNAGTISGGMGAGVDATRAAATTFTGGVNFLAITAGAIFNGDVVANSTADTLTLIGSGDGVFETSSLGASIRGFGNFQKDGAGAWTLNGGTTALTPWVVKSGTLIVSSDAALGDTAGDLTLNGGVLQLSTGFDTSRTILLGNGGAIDVASGSGVFSGQFYGPGALEKRGPGTLVLSGDNVFTGDTTVANGALRINGDQSTATGLVDVLAAGRLGGSGTVGGDVRVAGFLAPGNSPGTLTILGDLNLAPTAVLDYEFGQSNVVGGPMNDHTRVGGDLILDGTLNVSVTAGGVFGAGVYRIFTYDGALTDNGLDIGAAPGGSLTIQTAVSGQVNLIAAGLPTVGVGSGGGSAPPSPAQIPSRPPPPPPPQFTFWDGDGGSAADRAITGADGVWRADGSNWTTSDGEQNGALSAPWFAVFAGQGGAVRLDAGQGALAVNGAQFAADGYRLSGDELVLNGGVVRVGDGTVQSAALIATLDLVVAGESGLTKSDFGTLVLTGENTYGGHTAIAAGTLQIGDGGTKGSIRGDIANHGVLVFNRSDDVSFDGVIGGDGVNAQASGGVLRLTADSSAFAGRTEVAAGTLAVDGRLGGQTRVGSGARVAGDGELGSLANLAGGRVAPGNSLGALTVAGDYSGEGGLLQIEAELGDDASRADRLVVRGATSGTTPIEIVRLGGAGAATQDGILLVQVDGASNGRFLLAHGDYRLNGENALVAGAYAYVLRQDDGGDWRLRSLYQPGAPIYEAYPRALQTLNGLGTLRQRLGGRQWASQDGVGLWGRLESRRTRLDASGSTTASKLELDSWRLNFGLDRQLATDWMGGELTGAPTASYGEAKAGVASPFGGGKIETKGYGLGATLTYVSAGGLYVDAQAQASWFDSDLRSHLLGARLEGGDGRGQALSLEAGQALALGGLSLTPQIQFSYGKVGFDGFIDGFGAAVSDKDGETLTGRLGLALDYAWTQGGDGGRLYGLVNLSRELLGGTAVSVSGASLSNGPGGTWAGLALGGRYGWGGGRFEAYGEVSADAALDGFGDGHAVGGSAGFRMRF